MKTEIVNASIAHSRKRSQNNKIRGFNVKPVIKLNFGGILIFANSSGIDFLEKLSSHLKVPAIGFLLKYCPSLLDPDCNLDVCLKLEDYNYYFSIVAFKEAGYVGLYGYRIEQNNYKGRVIAEIGN